MMEESLLRIQGISKTFVLPGGRTKKVLHNVSLDVKKGEILGLMGISGGGKTTMARIIMGLEMSDQGKLTLDGTEISQLIRKSARSLYKRIQYIFQNPYESLSRNMTVKQLIAEPLLIQKLIRRSVQAEDKIARVLSEVELMPPEMYLNKYPHQLSGGERQRVAIARALVLEPEILLADEPVTMLDASFRLGIVHLLARLRQEKGLTIIFITHDLNLAYYFCDRIAVLYEGTIVECGEAEQLVTNPQHEHTHKLMSFIKAGGI